MVSQMGMTPGQFQALVQDRFPGVAAGKAALPKIVPDVRRADRHARRAARPVRLGRCDPDDEPTRHHDPIAVARRGDPPSRSASPCGSYGGSAGDRVRRDASRRAVRALAADQGGRRGPDERQPQARLLPSADRPGRWRAHAGSRDGHEDVRHDAHAFAQQLGGAPGSSSRSSASGSLRPPRRCRTYRLRCTGSRDSWGRSRRTSATTTP